MLNSVLKSATLVGLVLGTATQVAAQDQPVFEANQLTSFQDKHQGQPSPADSWVYGARIGAVIPTSAKEEVLNWFFAGGLFAASPPLDPEKRWNAELAFDFAYHSESGIDDTLLMFRGGALFSPSEKVYLAGGLGYGLELFSGRIAGFRVDETFDSFLVYIGAGVRFDNVDLRLDYLFFTSSDNTTGAVYISVGFWIK